MPIGFSIPTKEVLHDSPRYDAPRQFLEFRYGKAFEGCLVVLWKKKPIISYCVKCYNNEKYIAQALRAAFAQTYHPLEIVIGDDASTDASYKIISDMVATYKASGGAHAVKCFRNDTNLGNMGNWQKICEQANGELLVKADGDDYSDECRVEKLVAEWEKNGRKAFCVYSDAWAIDIKGRRLWPIDFSQRGVGAVEAYSRKCFTEFPSLDETLVGQEYDDVVYSERAKILGDERDYVQERLVYYRQGSGVSTPGRHYTSRLRARVISQIANMRQLLLDLEHVEDKFLMSRIAAFRKLFNARIEDFQMVHDIVVGKSLSIRWAAFRRIKQSQVFVPRVLGLIMLLPPAVRNGLLDLCFALNWKRKVLGCRMRGML